MNYRFPKDVFCSPLLVSVLSRRPPWHRLPVTNHVATAVVKGAAVVAISPKTRSTDAIAATRKTIARISPLNAVKDPLVLRPLTADNQTGGL